MNWKSIILDMNTLYPGFKDIIQIDVFDFYTSITTIVKQCIDYKKVVHESLHWQKFICFLMWPYLCTWTLITVNKILFTMLSCLSFFFFCYYCKFLFPGLIFSIQYSTVISYIINKLYSFFKFIHIHDKNHVNYQYGKASSLFN